MYLLWITVVTVFACFSFCDPDEWIDALCLASRAACMSFAPGVYFLAVINVTRILIHIGLRIHCARKHPTMVLAPITCPAQEYGWPGHMQGNHQEIVA